MEEPRTKIRSTKEEAKKKRGTKSGGLSCREE
ncbi:hypothetical protein JMJ77_0004717, partial [Colletotrichum scovillei]